MPKAYHKLRSKFIVNIVIFRSDTDDIDDVFRRLSFYSFPCYNDDMEEDIKKINKFLELLPDDLADSFFYLLKQNMIQDGLLNSVRIYIKYIAKFGLSFENKTLMQNHRGFFESISILDSFVLKNFFRNNPTDSVFVLHPDVRNSDPELWNKFAGELGSLIDDAESKYHLCRKSTENYLLGHHQSETKTTKETKKYPDVNETISIGTLGIIIGADYIMKGKEKIPINPTDRSLIEYLQYRFKEEKERCTALDILAKVTGNTEEYVANRISSINKIIRDLVLKGKTKSNIGDFIKNERKRGYHLNPQFVIDFTKKK
jgi:hypothetical protein